MKSFNHLTDPQHGWFQAGIVDLSDNKPHKQGCVDGVMISGSLGGVMVSTQALERQDV